jgi:hypothetical protein
MPVMTQFPNVTDCVQYVVVCTLHVNMLIMIHPDNTEEILGMYVCLVLSGT